MTPRFLALFFAAVAIMPAGAQTLDWNKIDEEAMRHYQALVRIDTTDPPGNETRVVEYLRAVLEAQGIPVTVAAKDPARANLIARLKGNGSKRPVIFMGHTDEVQVDPSKWTFPPFSATRQGGYVYGRGTLDDKSDLTAALMTVLLLKRSGLALDRDVIFVAEAGEEANTSVGIDYLVNDHWSDVDAEYCLAESGSVNRKNGQTRLAFVENVGEAPHARPPGGARTGRARLAADAVERDRTSGAGGGEDRGLGPAHAAERYHAELLREAVVGQHA